MHIEPYKQQHQQQVIALWRECSLLVPWNDPVKDIQRKCKQDPDLFVVGVERGAVIATAMGGYDGHRGWVYYLAVTPAKQRTGYGRQMMDYIEGKLIKLGCSKVNLQIRATNTRVIAFYRSLGYKQEQVVGMGKRLFADNNKNDLPIV